MVAEVGYRAKGGIELLVVVSFVFSIARARSRLWRQRVTAYVLVLAHKQQVGGRRSWGIRWWILNTFVR